MANAYLPGPGSNFAYYLDSGRIVYLPDSWSNLGADTQLQWIAQSNLTAADAVQLEDEMGISSAVYDGGRADADAAGSHGGTTVIGPDGFPIYLGPDGNQDNALDDAWLNRNVVYPIFNATSSTIDTAGNVKDAAAAAYERVRKTIDDAAQITKLNPGAVLAIGVGVVLLIALTGGGVKKKFRL